MSVPDAAWYENEIRSLRQSLTGAYERGEALSKENSRLRNDIEEIKERCAKVAENWTPPELPEFHSLKLQSEAEQMEAKLRPIQLEVAKQIASAIRKV